MIPMMLKSISMPLKLNSWASTSKAQDKLSQSIKSVEFFAYLGSEINSTAKDTKICIANA